MEQHSSLLSSVTLGPLTLRNRVCLSAVWMGRVDRQTGKPLPSLVAHYKAVAQGDCGLVIVEHTAVAPEGLADATMLRLYSDEHIAYHKEIVDTVHSVPGAKVIVQLNNAGANGVHPDRYAPSAVDVPGMGKGKEMTLAMIEQTKKDFVDAAKRAKAAGYDGIQIHSAHGYLLSSFLSPATNKRTDKYGGESIENRARLLLEIAHDIREAMGKDFAVALKINCNDFAGDEGVKPEEVGWICKQLEGVLDFVELSGGTPFGKHGTIRTGMFHKDPATELWYADELKTISSMTSMPLCVVGGVRTPAGAERALETGATLVSLGRPFIRHPDLVKYWEEGKAFSPCVSCNQCIMKPMKERCPVRCWARYSEGEFNPYEGEK